MSVITNLLNPCLQERHWQQIEDVINYRFSEVEEKLTLGKLIELNAFDYNEDLEEISGQASSEASLEALLKKVGLNQTYSICYHNMPVHFRWRNLGKPPNTLSFPIKTVKTCLFWEEPMKYSNCGTTRILIFRQLLPPAMSVPLGLALTSG